MRHLLSDRKNVTIAAVLIALCCLFAFSDWSSISQNAPAQTLSFSLDSVGLRSLHCPNLPQTECKEFQSKTLQAAIRLGAKQRSSWRTWEVDEVEEPLYGAWRFEQRIRIFEEQPSAENYIIITSIAPPTEQIKAWAAIPGWRVVVVGDDKSPKDWKLDGVIFLSIDNQLDLPFRFAKLVPHKNYARKAVGYLYAIQHGAKRIYETDDDNAPKADIGLGWIAAEHDSNVSKTDGAGVAVNPYAYFGHCTIWPRGYPLSDLLKNGANYCYPNNAVKPPSASGQVWVPVQQGLADLDPDVDAIWRLARPADIGKVKFKQAPGLAYSAHSFSPYNTQNTIHYQSAFWALFIPSGVNMRVCDIWRSYWAQRLLWEMGASVLFVSGTVDQVRNAHDYVKDFKDEMQMYVQVPALIDFLDTWRCRKSHMFDCMLQLGYDMAMHNFWSSQDLELLTAWVHDLAALGYEPPALSHKAMPMSTEARLATGKYHAAWQSSDETPGRMTLWESSKQQCAYFSIKPNSFTDPAGKIPPIYENPNFRPGPYLSIVLTTSAKDETGQHFRLSHFLKNLAAYTTKYSLWSKVELIIIDYNSPPGSPELWELPSIRLPDTQTLPLIRVIKVTPEMHVLLTHKVKSFSDPGFWEYLGKNIGIRRACGEYILSTNPDAWLSDGFWQMVAAGGFNRTKFYRMGRIETYPEAPDWSTGSLDWAIDDVEKALASKTGVVCGPNPREPNAGGKWQFDSFPDLANWLAAPKINLKEVQDRGKEWMVGCAGDFTLMHRDAFFAVRGYPEVPIPTWLDEVFLKHALDLGMTCAVPPAPAALFHISHSKSYRDNAMEVWNVVDKKIHSVFGPKQDDRVKMYNDEHWGMGRQDLIEIYV